MARSNGERRASTDCEDGELRAVISANVLATWLDVPVAVLTFLEARLPEVKAIAEGPVRRYRGEDAALLAGLTELLYDKGVPLRDGLTMLRTGRRASVLAMGRERLRSTGPIARMAEPAMRPIPRDAIVHWRGAPPNRSAEPAEAPEPSALLAELIACVELLDGARHAR